MAKRIRYYYDEESCTFQEEKITAKSVFKTSILLLVGVGVAAYFFFYEDPKHMLLQYQNDKMRADIQVLGESLAQLESQVNNLHLQDNELYRSLLDADRIDEGSWNGGIGGAIGRKNEPEESKVTRQSMERLQRKVDIQSKSYALLFDMLEANEERLRHLPSIKPVTGGVISGFGMRKHPIHKIRKMHTGLDLEAARGTEIRAAGDGVVRLSGVSKGGYGRQIEIDHGGFGYVTKYAHLSKILVRKGDKVKRGDVIGLSGNTGLSKGPHLHYEVIKKGSKIDPIDFFYGDQTPEQIVKMRKKASEDVESMD